VDGAPRPVIKVHRLKPNTRKRRAPCSEGGPIDSALLKIARHYLEDGSREESHRGVHTRIAHMPTIRQVILMMGSSAPIPRGELSETIRIMRETTFHPPLGVLFCCRRWLRTPSPAEQDKYSTGVKCRTRDVEIEIGKQRGARQRPGRSRGSSKFVFFSTISVNSVRGRLCNGVKGLGRVKGFG